MSKVDREVAENAVNAWLDVRRASEDMREAYVDVIEMLTQGVERGELVVLETEGCKIIQNLIFPIGDEEKINTLQYSPRINVGQVQSKLSMMKGNDTEQKIMANIAASSNKGVSIIKKMDTDDYKLASAIGVFFLY